MIQTMRIKQLFAVALLAFSLIACKNDKEADTIDEGTEETATSTEMSEKTINVNMASKSGSSVEGTVKFKTMGMDGVMMSVALTGLEPGTHAIHIHEFGDCSADDATSAGGHWNPTSEEHGKWGEDQHHLGDIANLEANENGAANLTFTTERWSLNEGDDNSIVGKSVVVHAKADDFTSQPSGAAGARVACGEIQ